MGRLTNYQATRKESSQQRGSASAAGFFAYHGWLAPGVRLFRRLQFPAKAALVSVTFLLPLVMAILQNILAGHATIRTAEDERAGVLLTRPAYALLQASHAQRLALAEGKGRPTEAERRAFDALTQAVAASPAHFGLSAKLSELRKQREAAATGGIDTQDAYVQSVLHLIDVIADRSSLSLDPELDSYHMMNVAIMQGPKQMEATARLRDAGMQILTEGQPNPAVLKVIEAQRAIQDFVEESAEASYQKVVRNAPEQMEKLFDMKGTDAAVEALGKYTDRFFRDAQNLGQAETLRGLGERAYEKQGQLNARMLDTLEAALEARIAGVKRDLLLQVTLTGLCVLVAVYLFLAFYRVTMGGLTEVRRHLDEISAGNLTLAPRPWGNDEAANLMNTLHSSQANLQHVVSAVIESAANVQTAAEEIESASQDLARRTERNAAELEETATSMQVIASNANRTVEIVHNASNIVDSNAVSARHSGETIEKVVQTMDGIRASSDKIGEIISVIDGIAFQTNILALNAAVEAARAGEQGRGFAVVASEVRTLAQRSAAAAKEIKTLIEESLSRVEAGSKVVHEAGGAISEVVDNAARIATLMSEIRAMAEDQRSGADQVKAAIASLDDSTQQNAALVEETSSSASVLSSQAQRLSDEIGFFRLKAFQ